MVLVGSSTELVFEKILIYHSECVYCFMESRIPSNGRLIDTLGGGHMYLMILDLLQLFFANAFMSTRPVGGCHDSLLGCDINPLHSRSNQGSTLVALAVRASTELLKQLCMLALTWSSWLCHFTALCAA